jgi:hypothetical protein
VALVHFMIVVVVADPQLNRVILTCRQSAINFICTQKRNGVGCCFMVEVQGTGF